MTDNNLKFASDGKFRILCLGDLHEKLKITSHNSQQRLDDMHKLFEMSVKAFKPELIVLMGDTLCSWDDEGGIPLYIEALERILKPFIERNLPIAYVLGNHEHDAKQEKSIIEAYTHISNCLAFNDEPSVSGYLNYYLHINASNSESPVFNLWFIDSNNVSADRTVSHYDWVHLDQIEWYEKKSAQFREENNGNPLPSILFQHIPVTEEYDLLREATLPERPIAVKGHFKWGDRYFVAKDGVEGYLGEGPCAPFCNDGQFESWKRMGDVKGAFFGHDHLNDFTGTVDGIKLGQNKTSGFRAYTDGCRSCVRLITLDENDIDNWTTRVYHFKELGLECTCLGPIQKRISDRQSINMHMASYIAAGTAGAAGTAAGIAKLIKKLK